MTATQTRLQYDAISAALAVAGAQLGKASPSLAALVHLAPLTTDPTAPATAQVRNGQCVFSSGFAKLTPDEAAVTLAHVALHLILGHDQRLSAFLAAAPTGNARLFNAACDLAIAQLLAPLTSPPRMPLAAPAASLSAATLEIALAPTSLDDNIVAHRLGLATPTQLLNASPEAIYCVLNALPIPQRAALVGPPGSRPLSDDLRPATTHRDRISRSANEDLAAIARHLSAPLEEADGFGIIGAIRRRLDLAPSDWRLRLRTLLESAANPPAKPTFARPDHRQASRGKQAIYMPGRAQPKRKPIVAIIDPYAAIAPRHIQTLLFELSRLSKARPSRIVVIVATDPLIVAELPRSGQPPQVTQAPRAYRTDLTTALATARSYAPEAIICLTDLCVIAPRGPAPAPVFFAPASNTAPTGRRIEIPFQ